jgi:adenylate cyclase
MSTSFPTEIERTHLVTCVPENLGSGMHLRQWYIPISSIEIHSNISINGIELVSNIAIEWITGVFDAINNEDPTIRIRLDGDEAILCIKGPSYGITRTEFEWKIGPYSIIENLVIDSEWPMVEKMRWRIQYNDSQVWDLDQFLGLNENLWLAEIELEKEDEQYDCPKWVGKEVTGDMRFTSKRLAHHSFSKFIDQQTSPKTDC